eukprot:4375319-Pleurochrysis_carterae.AAC.2
MEGRPLPQGRHLLRKERSRTPTSSAFRAAGCAAAGERPTTSGERIFGSAPSQDTTRPSTQGGCSIFQTGRPPTSGKPRISLNDVFPKDDAFEVPPAGRPRGQDASRQSGVPPRTPSHGGDFPQDALAAGMNCNARPASRGPGYSPFATDTEPQFAGSGRLAAAGGKPPSRSRNMSSVPGGIFG